MPTPAGESWWATHKIPFVGPGGAIDGVIGFSLDITARKQMELELKASQELYQTIANYLPNGAVHIYDRELRFLFSAGPELAALQTSHEALVGKSLEEVFPAAVAVVVRANLELVLHEGRTVSFEGALGRRHYVVNAAPLRNSLGQVDRVLMLSTNVSAVQEALAGLAAKSALLDRSNRELEQFAYVASHDLQEPLRMISSFVQLLQQQLGSQLTERQKSYMEFAVEGSARLQRLIEDLLDLSRIDRISRPFAAVSFGSLLDRSLAAMGPTIAAAEGRVIRRHLPALRVTGDAPQLERLLIALLANAAKFRSPGPLEIEISAELEREGWWRFTIRDNGIGIAPAYHERIFTIFKRLHGREQYPGTGIGLALARKIVERHGGRIWVMSQEGEGAAFSFTLPAVREDGP